MNKGSKPLLCGQYAKIFALPLLFLAFEREALLQALKIQAADLSETYKMRVTLNQSFGGHLRRWRFRRWRFGQGCED
jgi:hypothetical protein